MTAFIDTHTYKLIGRQYSSGRLEEFSERNKTRIRNTSELRHGDVVSMAGGIICLFREVDFAIDFENITEAWETRAMPAEAQWATS